MISLVIRILLISGLWAYVAHDFDLVNFLLGCVGTVFICIPKLDPLELLVDLLTCWWD